MLLVDMTPEEIRDVFENHGDNLHRLEHAILVALDQLGWITDRKAKAQSPFSISKLTAGLPEQERNRIVDHAIRMSNAIQAIERSSGALQHGPATRPRLNRSSLEAAWERGQIKQVMEQQREQSMGLLQLTYERGRRLIFGPRNRDQDQL